MRKILSEKSLYEDLLVQLLQKKFYMCKSSRSTKKRILSLTFGEDIEG